VANIQKTPPATHRKEKCKEGKEAAIKAVQLKGGGSVADPDPEPDPEGSETFGRIRIRSGTEINILDPVSDPDFGSGLESGFESGSEINQKKGA
jgi:hypothetical protein